MCGIFGSVQGEGALEGLQRLEYRGYDSAGLAGILGGEIIQMRRIGKVACLKEAANNLHFDGAVIAHTRWATHGAIHEKNAHPILSPSGRFACVHNGIIENSHELRSELMASGALFSSDTDTEVIVQLADQMDHLSLREMVFTIAKRLKGRSSFALIDKHAPTTIVGASLGSSLVIGIGAHLIALASDQHAFDERIQRISHVPVGHVVELGSKSAKFFNPLGEEVPVCTEPFAFDKSDSTRGAHDHFMYKEMLEQPGILSRLLKKEQMPLSENFNRVVLIGCGTAWHAGGIGAFWIEHYLKIPAVACVASEFRYGPALIDEKSLVIAISQSGETADTLAAVEKAKERGAFVIALCNRASSALERLADETRLLQAGPEIGVASTKAYTASLALLWQMVGGPLPLLSQELVDTFAMSSQVEALAAHWNTYNQLLMIGRGPMLWTAREAALKIKELAYVHASAYPAGELKHGPIALVDESCPTVLFCSEEHLAPKIRSSLMEIQARSGRALLIAPKRLASHFEGVDVESLFYPSSDSRHDPFLSAALLQLFAYFVAKERSCSIDQPRNLAKSVTVE